MGTGAADPDRRIQRCRQDGDPQRPGRLRAQPRIEVLSGTATPEFVGRFADLHLPRVLNRLNRRLTGIGAAGVSVDSELVDRPAPAASLRTRLEEVAELIEPRGGGVLIITLDGVNTTSAADMRSWRRTSSTPSVRIGKWR